MKIPINSFLGNIICIAEVLYVYLLFFFVELQTTVVKSGQIKWIFKSKVTFIFGMNLVTKIIITVNFCS